MSALKLTCKECKADVAVVNGEVIRSCKCAADTGVVADMSATATGKSKVAGK